MSRSRAFLFEHPNEGVNGEDSSLKFVCRKPFTSEAFSILSGLAFYERFDVHNRAGSRAEHNGFADEEGSFHTPSVDLTNPETSYQNQSPALPAFAASAVMRAVPGSISVLSPARLIPYIPFPPRLFTLHPYNGIF